MWEIIIQISTPTQKQISAAVNFHQLVVGEVGIFFEKVESPDRDCSRFQPLMT